MPRISNIAKLCHAINTAKKLNYPAVGFLYRNDAKDEESNQYLVFQVAHTSGFSVPFWGNGKTSKETANNLRQYLKFAQNKQPITGEQYE